MDAVRAVQHDATSLYKFIDDVSKGCADQNQFSYTQSSRDFFTFVADLGSAAKSHVSNLSTRLDQALLASDPKDFARQAQELATLRFAWYQLHKFIKPALDAHTLESPYSLVDALTLRLRQISGFDSVRFAIVHTSDLNYFQLQSTFLRKLVNQIAQIISSAPPFPTDLAIVGIPYSQAGSVFLNIALAHEMGHFAFQRTDQSTQLSSDVVQKLIALGASNLSPADVTTCVNLVLDWLEEVYCDLFALCLAGPSFSFAFIDLLSLTRFEPSKDFQSSHPANALRLREQAKLLQDPASGWWTAITNPGNHYVEVLKKALSRQDSDFKYGSGTNGSVEDLALRCFLSLLMKPKEAVLSLFSGIDSGLSEFVEKLDRIKAYLSYGIVPSRLVMEDGPNVPSGVCLLNATYVFYLENLDDLLLKLANVDPNCLECRAHWAQRVEMWLGKALEDTNTNGYTIALSH